MTETFDIIIIGGGRASALAVASAKSGKKVALIERDKLGGACPNRGCVPSKLLIGFAEAARSVKEADQHFTKTTYEGTNSQAVFDDVNQWISGVDPRYQTRLEDANVELIRGEGAFVGEKTVEVNGRKLTAEKIVIATGSYPTPPPYPELPVWTSDNLFPMTDTPPKSILIIGSGFIGTEMASFFSGIGVDTKLFARGDKLLKSTDSDIEKVFREQFSEDVDTYLHASLTDLNYADKQFTAKFNINGKEQEFKADRVLFAIGRRPSTDRLGLQHTKIETDKRGFITVNKHLETSSPDIYACGDVNGRYMLQHAASFEVQYLRNKFLKNEQHEIDNRYIAHAVFSHPEVASVGHTEEELKTMGIRHVAVITDWLASARAMSTRLSYPRTKLIVSPDDYSILGCHLVGPESSTLLHQVLMLMHLKNDVRELLDMVYIHPGLNELFLTAAVDAISAVRKANS